MANFFEQIAFRTAAGEAVAACVVVGTRGSTPQGAGAKMLCMLDGATVGTLGGGCVEAEVRRRAIALLVGGGSSQLMTFRLDSDYGWDDGLICGGSMEIFVDVIRDRAGASPYARVAGDLRAGRSTRLELAYRRGEEARAYAEEIGPPPVLVIAGAGHVGQALAAVAATLGFAVDVIDDRGDCASRERFPSARALVVGEIEQSLAAYPIDGNTYVVVVTRGHRHDGRALAAVASRGARYVGLIGSRSKVKLIFADLHAAGVPADDLARVHAPVGLEIGAVTVPEIAVSIAAELVAVRRGRGGLPASPMKGDAEQLRAWLRRGTPDAPRGAETGMSERVVTRNSAEAGE